MRCGSPAGEPPGSWRRASVADTEAEYGLTGVNLGAGGVCASDTRGGRIIGAWKAEALRNKLKSCRRSSAGTRLPTLTTHNRPPPCSSVLARTSLRNARRRSPPRCRARALRGAAG